MIRNGLVFLLLAATTTAGTASADQTPDGAATWRVRKQALAAYRAKDWDRASELYGQTTRENPWDGALWERYGLALHSAGRHDEAAEAFEQCRAIGYRWMQSTYNLVCALARAGRVDAALDALDEAFAAGYVDEHHSLSIDSDLDALRDHARFARIVGLPPDPDADRAERWHHDLDYLDERLRRLHYALFGVLSREDYERQLSELHEAVSSTTDEQLRWRIQRMLATIGDGHTSVVPDWFLAAHGGPHFEYEIYPLDFWWYPDGVRLRSAPQEHADALGARVVAIGQTPIDEALESVMAHASRDNEPGARWITMSLLGSPSAMRALGLARPDGSLDLTLEVDGGEHVISVSTTTNVDPVETTRLGDDADAPTPTWRKHPDRNYWFEMLEDDVAYFQFNVVRDMHGESIADFAERFFDEIESNGTTALVIDLRNNHGGSGNLNLPLLHRIAASPLGRRGNLYVIIGRQTFSAAMNFATALEVNTGARFVGEPTGSRPNFVGESSVFLLPYSGLAISCSNRWFQGTDSLDRRVWIPPHIPTPITVEDDAANRDPALEAILEILAADREHSG